MKHTFNIGELSDFFKLPSSTLRYWEEKGILHPNKNPENQYREYSLSDLMSLSDIIFYKSLGISLKQIREMDTVTPAEHETLFQNKIQQLETERQELEKRIQKLHCRLSAIESLWQLELHPFSKTDIDTECIISFDLLEKEKLQQYIENPYLYSRVQHSHNLSVEQRGLTITTEQINAFSSHPKLWVKNHSTYVSCLMKENVSENFTNNLPELLAHVQRKYKTGYIISRFLLRAREENSLFDFYKTFIEILE